MPDPIQHKPVPITDIAQAFANPRRGDCICLDIDEVLALPAEHQMEMLRQLTWLKEVGIKVIAVTECVNLTANELSHFAPLMTVIQQESAASAKSKAVRFITHIAQLPDADKPKRIVAVSSSEQSLQELQDSIETQRKEITDFPPVLLRQYSRPLHQSIFNATAPANAATHIPASLEKYRMQKALGGGTESTFQISAQDQSTPPLVLKYGANQDAIKLEILCNAIYRLLGVKVPNSEAFNTIPTELAQQLKPKQNPHNIFQVAEFIELAETQDEAAIIASAKKYFIVHALLGNIDITKMNNFIQAKNGDVYLIDAGSNFVLRARGDVRKEDSKIVTEIESLRQSNVDAKKAKWFGDITSAEIKQQVQQLLARESEIERVVWELAQRLQLSDNLRLEFLQLLSDRLDNLALRFCSEIPRHAKVDRNVQPGQNAAGVLTYAMRNNEPVVLLAKRSDHNASKHAAAVGLWDCFGGGADAADKFLHNTAAREVYEESTKGFSHPPAALLDCPFHDIITEKNGAPFVYRMYLREHEYVDAAKFTDREHTEYQWVKLSDLQAGLQQSSFNDANGKATVNVTANGKPLTLYPEFYQLLKQPAVQNNLADLEKGKPLRPTHTQGIPNQAHHQESSARRFHSPEQRTWQSIRTVLDHLQVMAALKAKKAEKAKDETSQPSKPSEFETQSELHLRAMLGSNNVEKNVVTMIDDIVASHKITISPEQRIRLQNHCLRLMQAEKQAGPERVFFYHGCSKEIAFAYDVYSAIHQVLQANPEWCAFRGTNEYFKSFSNIVEFAKHYSDGSGNINNNAENYNEVAIAANWALFGSHQSTGSCTLEYFLNGATAREIDLSKLLKSILSSSGMPETFVVPLLAIFTQHYTDKMGVLYQLSMPTDVADSLAYAAVKGGPLNPYNGTHEPSKIAQHLKADLASGAKAKIEVATEYLCTLQARVMVPPHQRVEVNRITEHDLNGTAAGKSITDFPSTIVNLIYEMLLNMNADTLDPTTPAARLITLHLAKNGLTSKEALSKIALKKAILMKDSNLVVRCITESPLLAEYALAICIQGGNAEMAKHIITAAPQLTDKDRKIQLPETYIGETTPTAKALPLIELILSQRVARANLLVACFGAKWPYDLPKRFNEHDLLLPALDALPANERCAYVKQYLNRMNLSATLNLNAREIIRRLPENTSDKLEFFLFCAKHSMHTISDFAERSCFGDSPLIQETTMMYCRALSNEELYGKLPAPNFLVLLSYTVSSYKLEIALGYATTVGNMDLNVFNKIISQFADDKEKQTFAEHEMNLANAGKGKKQAALLYLAEHCSSNPDENNLVVQYAKKSYPFAEYAIAACIKSGNAQLAAIIMRVEPKLKNNAHDLPGIYWGPGQVTAVGNPLAAGSLAAGSLYLSEAIMLYGKNHTKLLEAVYGPKWFKSLHQGLKHNADTFSSRLKLLPPVDRYDYATKKLIDEGVTDFNISEVLSLLPDNAQLNFILFCAKSTNPVATESLNHRVSFLNISGGDALAILTVLSQQKLLHTLELSSFDKLSCALDDKHRLQFTREYVAARPDRIVRLFKSLCFRTDLDNLHNRLDIVHALKILHSTDETFPDEITYHLLVHHAETGLQIAIIEGDSNSIKGWRRHFHFPGEYIFKHHPNVFEMIMLHGQSKELLLKAFYGEKWLDLITPEALISCAKKIETPQQLQAALEPLNREQATIVCTAWRDEFPRILKTTQDYIDVLQALHLDGNVALYVAGKSNLLDQINTAQEFSDMTKALLPFCKDRISFMNRHTLRKFDDWKGSHKEGDILFARGGPGNTPWTGFILDQHHAKGFREVAIPLNSFFAQYLERIETLELGSRSPYVGYRDYDEVVAIWNAEGQWDNQIVQLFQHSTMPCTDFHAACKNKLPVLIQTVADYFTVHSVLTPSQHTTLFDDCKQRLPHIIQTKADLKYLSTVLNGSQIKELKKLIKEYVENFQIEYRNIGRQDPTAAVAFFSKANILARLTLTPTAEGKFFLIKQELQKSHPRATQAAQAFAKSTDLRAIGLSPASSDSTA